LKIESVIIRSKAVALFAVVLFMLACKSDGAGGGISGSNTDSPVQAELVHGSLFVVNALVNNSINLDMLVDTGASGTHVPAAIFGNEGGEVRIASLCLENDMCFKSFKAQSTDSAFTQSTPGYFNGIIGLNLLKQFDVTFDYRRKLLYFYDTIENISASVENVSASVVSIPFSYQSGRPFTHVSIEGQPQGNNLLDTGAAFTRITSAMLEPLIQEPDVLFESVVFNLHGSEIVEYFPLNDYCLGTTCPAEIIAQEGSWPAIGGTFFREYLTVFKFSDRVVKLEPYNDRSHIIESGLQRIGLQINITDASDIVFLNDGSFAWEAGLIEEDEIISLNGIPIDDLGYFGIYELLADTSIVEYLFRIRTPEGDVEDVVVLAN
jgi:hypothetical protein